MRVRMLLQITGTRNGVSWPRPGGFVDLPESEARCLVINGYAKPAPEPVVEEVERAVSEPVEEEMETATVEVAVKRKVKKNG